MWFRVLSLVIAVALLGKAAIALAAPQRFYTARQRQYASELLPPRLLIAPVVVVGITAASWYAVIFRYQPWGWVVTGFLTMLSCMSVDHLLRWPRHRQAMLGLVSSPRTRQVDRFLIALGVAFVGLAMWVY